MTRPRLLDLFCGAGGAAVGYHQAGFDVVGVDIEPQPRYPFEFHQADALTFPLEGFDAIHASPPCQGFSVTTNYRPENRAKYPDLIGPTRERLVTTGVPYVIENVPGAPLRQWIQLCGTGFARDIQRHRWFEASFPAFGVPCAHGRNVPRFPHSSDRTTPRRVVDVGRWAVPWPLQQQAMGIDWMTLDELSEAIPSFYTRFVGEQLLAHLEAAA